MPVSDTLNRRVTPRSFASRHRRSARPRRLGELDGVADQIGDDLPQPAGVAHERSGMSGRMWQASSNPF